MKVYGVATQVFNSIKDAKKYANKYYSEGTQYVLHYGIKKDGDISFNSGKKLIVKSK